ncbi:MULTISPECIES: PucR family transcriptional regulator [Aeribacillus]|uniref:PucR family transcriptional regulator n=1 Tax=Aeribacillus pallidus TaxID=33936 RepID=A0A223E6R1_9BACI|nr:PucR family transcriptional regulator [Aeribacillus pallidus]ASS90883.1 PucR family transcriptional regulator [Aeribacillus pallidus]
MKISEILKIPVMKNAKLIAGHNGKDREVFSVNMMDAPDIIDFLKANELLVTTAFHLKDNPNDLLALIKNMADQQCAGLAIKMKRFLEEIPEACLKYANEKNFPIIELPIEVTLGEVVNQTLSYILDKRTNELLNAIEIHQQFTNHILRGKGLVSLLENLANLIGCPILLLDQHFQMIASSSSVTSSLPEIEEMYTDGFRFFLQPSSYTCFSIISSKRTVSVFPIYTHESNSGCLIVFDAIPFHSPSLVLTIEQATNVISFELMKKNALKQHKRKVQNEFFINFTDGAFQSKEEIVIKAKEFKIRNDQSYFCAAGKLDERKKSLTFTQFHKENERIFEFMEKEADAFPNPVHFFVKGNVGILLFPIQKSWLELHSSIMPFLKELQAKIRSRFQRTVSFGIGSLCQQFLDVKKGYKEALEVLEEEQYSGNQEFIQIHKKKDIYTLLKMIPKEELIDFYEQILTNLSDPADTEKQALLQTLFLFLENHCQISETAKKLFVHRNTVIYRLEKCEELIGKSLKDPEATISLRLAFRIKNLLQL